jgi:uncharacterized membrane protein YtjA (UPF0391 family)
MLYWSLVFLVIATMAGTMALGGISAGSAAITQLLLVFFLGFVALSVVAGVVRRAR